MNLKYTFEKEKEYTCEVEDYLALEVVIDEFDISDCKELTLEILKSVDQKMLKQVLEQNEYDSIEKLVDDEVSDIDSIYNFLKEYDILDDVLEANRGCITSGLIEHVAGLIGDEHWPIMQ